MCATTRPLGVCRARAARGFSRLAPATPAIKSASRERPSASLCTLFFGFFFPLCTYTCPSAHSRVLPSSFPELASKHEHGAKRERRAGGGRRRRAQAKVTITLSFARHNSIIGDPPFVTHAPFSAGCARIKYFADARSASRARSLARSPFSSLRLFPVHLSKLEVQLLALI